MLLMNIFGFKWVYNGAKSWKSQIWAQIKNRTSRTQAKLNTSSDPVLYIHVNWSWLAHVKTSSLLGSKNWYEVENIRIIKKNCN